MFHDPSLRDQRVLVTAGANGIGLQIALGFLANDARVFVCDVDAAALKAALAAHPGLQGVVADVADEAAVAALFTAADTALGGLDVLVNNAGIAGPTGRVDALRIADVRRTLEVNVLSQFLCAMQAVPRLLQGRRPAIVNLASAAGHLGMPGRSAYAASKWAVVGFTKSLAIELGREGIRVNAVLPGAVDGPRIRAVIAAKAAQRGLDVAAVTADYEAQSSLGRMVTMQDVADTVLFACSGCAGSITGQSLAVDGHTQALS